MTTHTILNQIKSLSVQLKQRDNNKLKDNKDNKENQGLKNLFAKNE